MAVNMSFNQSLDILLQDMQLRYNFHTEIARKLDIFLSYSQYVMYYNYYNYNTYNRNPFGPHLVFWQTFRSLSPCWSPLIFWNIHFGIYFKLKKKFSYKLTEIFFSAHWNFFSVLSLELKKNFSDHWKKNSVSL